MERGDGITVRGEIGDALRRLVRRPFSTLLAVALLASVVTTSITLSIRPDDTGQAMTTAELSLLVLVVVSAYVQIAAVLAAAADGDVKAADPWIRAALRNRSFFRYLAVIVVQLLLVGLGAFLLVVGAVVVGGIVALAPSAVVLERLGPFDALRRSAELTKPARRVVAIVFAVLVLLVPVVLATLRSLHQIHLGSRLQVALTIVASVLSFTSVIALTRIFVKLRAPLEDGAASASG